MSFTITQQKPTDSRGLNLRFANQLPTSTPTITTGEQVNPRLEGTPAAFGGTAGIKETQDDVKILLPAATSTVTNDTAGVKNVLNDSTTVTYSGYDALVNANAQNKLLDLQNKANNYLLKEADSKRFFNLSLAEIIDHTILTVVVIFSELLSLMRPEEADKRKNMSFGEKFSEYAQVFLQKDRIIYLGIFLIFISILFMTIFLSS